MKFFTSVLLLGSVLTSFGVGAATFTVNNNNDSGAGSLRQAILNSNATASTPAAPNIINIDSALAANISITSNLPVISQSVNIAPTAAAITVNGNNTAGLFFAYAGTVNLSKLNINNGKSTGGVGGGGGGAPSGGPGGAGGGGLGAGGGLFINTGATVNLSDVAFSGNNAQGGAGGGATGSSSSGGGGGMLGGAGGTSGPFVSCGGGGGLGATGGVGGTGLPNPGNAGSASTLITGVSSGGIGGTSPEGPVGGGAGANGGGGGGGGGASGTNNRANGGGGGIGGTNANAATTAGVGGDFGGGGGNVNIAVTGGLGGFGGGGGGGQGGGGTSVFGGGNGGGGGGAVSPSPTPGGSGGSGYGGAVFVRKGGTLVIANSTTSTNFTGSTVTAGLTGGTGGINGSASGQDFFFHTNDSSGSTPFGITFNVGNTFTQTLNGTIDSGTTAGSTFTKSGLGTLVLNGVNTYSGATNQISGGTLQISQDANLGNVANTIAFNNGTLKITAGFSSARSLIMTGAGTVDTNGFNLTLSGPTSGVGGLSKSGTGTLTIQPDAAQAVNHSGGVTLNANSGIVIYSLASGGTITYSGGTTINSGATLQMNSANAMPSLGDVTFNGAGLFVLSNNNQTIRDLFDVVGNGNISLGSATLTVNSTNGSTYSGIITGSGGLIKSGAQTLTLSGPNGYGGGTTVTAGILQGTTTSLQGAILNNASVVFNQVGNGTYAGAMTGTGSLTKQNVGTVILGGANLYSGGTTVSGGVLQGTTTSLQGAIVNNASVVFDQTTSGTYGGVMNGNGTLTKQNTGTVILSGASGYTGGTNITGGILEIGAINNLGASGGISITNGSTLRFNTTGITMNRAVTLGVGGGIFSSTGAGVTTTVSGAIGETGGAQAMTFAGPGTFILQTASTYTGGTNMTGGIVEIGAINQLGASGGINISNGSTLRFNTTGITVNRAITLGAGGGIFSSTGAGVTTTVSGAIGEIGGAQAMTFAGPGTFILQMASTYTGGTNMTGGIVEIGAINQLGTSGGINISNGSTLRFNTTGITVNRAITLGAGNGIFSSTAGGVTTTVSGAIGETGGARAMSFAGPGTFILQTASTYTGGTNITGGIVEIGAINQLGASGGINISNGSALRFNTSLINVNRAVTFGAGGGVFTSTGAGVITTLSGAIGETGGARPVTYLGPGTFIATNNANNYTGGTTVFGSTLQIASDLALGGAAGGLTFNNGTLALTAGIISDRTVTLTSAGTIDTGALTSTFSGQFTGAGGLTKLGTGILALTNVSVITPNNYSGGTIISSGTVQISTDSQLGTAIAGVTLNAGGKLGFTADVTTARNLIFNAGVGTIDTGGTNSILSGVLSGAGSFSVGGIGAGTLSLTNISGITPNSYSGGTVFTGGTLLVTLDQQLGAIGVGVGGLTFNGGALRIGAAGFTTARTVLMTGAGTIDTNGFDVILSGAITGGGGVFTKDGLGTLSLTNPANNPTGGIVVSLGILQGNSTSLKGNITNNSTVAFDQALIGSYTSVMSGVGSLLLQGTGTLALTQVNTYGGGTFVSGTSTLRTDLNNALPVGGAVTLQAGTTLHLNTHNQIVGDVSGGGNINLAGAQLTAGSNSVSTTFSGNITGNGNLVKQGNGTWVLSGNNNYVGLTTVNAGTLQGNSNSLPGNIVNNATLVLDQAADITWGGTINGAGTIIKQNIAKINLTQPTTAANTNINGGKLAVNAALTSVVNVNPGGILGGVGPINGNVFNNGTVVPANSIGNININGDYIVGPGGITQVELDPSGASSHFIINGNAVLNGTLDIIALGAFSANIQYQIINVNGPGHTVTGSFNNITPPTIGAFQPQVLYDPVTATVQISFIRHSLKPQLTGANPNQIALANSIDGFTTPPVGSDEADNFLGPITNFDIVNNGRQDSVFEALESIIPVRVSAAGPVVVQDSASTVNNLSGVRLAGLRQNIRAEGAVGGFVPLAYKGMKEMKLTQQEDPLHYLNQMKGRSNGSRTKSFNTTRNGLVTHAARQMHPLMIQGSANAGVWLQGLGQVIDQKPINTDPGFIARTGGVVAGVDFSPEKGFIVGGGLGQARSQVGFLKNGGSSHISHYFGTLYGTWFPDQWYVDAALAAGTIRYHIQQRIQFGWNDRVARANYNGLQVTPHLGAGYEFEFEKTRVTPFANMDFSYTYEGNYVTTDALSFNQKVSSRVSTSIRSEAGVKAATTYDFENAFASGSWEPNASLSFIHKSILKSSKTNVSFVAETGQYTVQYYSKGHSQISPGAGADFYFKGGMFFSVRGDMEMGSNYRSYEVNLKLGMAF